VQPPAHVPPAPFDAGAPARQPPPAAARPCRSPSQGHDRRWDDGVHIRTKIAAEAQQFLPEKSITDVEALRRDYEKLRTSYELGRAIGVELDLTSCSTTSSSRLSSCSRPTAASCCCTRATRDEGTATAGAAFASPPTPTRTSSSRPRSSNRSSARGRGAQLRRDARPAILAGALDHHAGHSQFDGGAIAATRTTCWHHGARLADQHECLRREGPSAVHQHREPGRPLDRERHARQAAQRDAIARERFQRLLSPQVASW